MVLGITGCPGSGKSALAGFMIERGWVPVDADKIGHEVVEKNRDVLGELTVAFGSDILDSKGVLDRRLLAGRAFATKETRDMLNRAVHPRLIELLEERIHELRGSGENAVVDCALIFEWGIERRFDCVVCVAADESLCKKRLMERDGRSTVEIEGLFSAQLLERMKIKKSDVVIMNNGSLERLKLFAMILSDLPRYFKGV